MLAFYNFLKTLRASDKLFRRLLEFIKLYKKHLEIFFFFCLIPQLCIGFNDCRKDNGQNSQYGFKFSPWTEIRPSSSSSNCF